MWSNMLSNRLCCSWASFVVNQLDFQGNGPKPNKNPGSLTRTQLKVDLLGKSYDCFVREKAFMEPAGVRDRKAKAAGPSTTYASSSSRPMVRYMIMEAYCRPLPKPGCKGIGFRQISLNIYILYHK